MKRGVFKEQSAQARGIRISEIRKLVLFTTLLVMLFFYLSCGKDSCNCSISNGDEAILSVYKTGYSLVFKNDATGELDTLNCTATQKHPVNCSSPCNKGIGGMNARFNFSNKGQHLKDCSLSVWSPVEPHISYDDLIPLFVLIGITESVDVNNITYDDVYEMSIDSNAIPEGERYHIPWRIWYSRSNGFIRFDMPNGQSWSRL